MLSFSKMPRWYCFLTKAIVSQSRFISLINTKFNENLAVRLKGLFWVGNKVGYFSSFELQSLPLEASHYARPKAPIPIFY